jgi:hypothetical protein
VSFSIFYPLLSSGDEYFLHIGQRDRVFCRDRVEYSTYEPQSRQSTEYKPDQTVLAAIAEVAMQAINEAEGQSNSTIIRKSLAECKLFSLAPGRQK